MPRLRQIFMILASPLVKKDIIAFTEEGGRPGSFKAKLRSNRRRELLWHPAKTMPNGQLNGSPS